MSEDERAAFLSRFACEDAGTLVGFVVMGGIFGEGIGLYGDRLSGAVIVEWGCRAYLRKGSSSANTGPGRFRPASNSHTSTRE